MRVVIRDTSSTTSAAVSVILFGAFDRHNFGDLLFPHITATLLGEKNPVCAGVAARDLRCYGGHRVESLADLAVRWRDRPVNLIHAGGELLTCDAWQAAVMTLPPDEALDVVVRFDEHPRKAQEWAEHTLGIAALAPYAVQRTLFPHAQTVLYNAVGGVDLAERDHAFRQEVLSKLQAADEVGVRDVVTRTYLDAAGIRTRLMPDPAVMVEELFGADIRRRANEGEPAEMRRAFPQGYLAVQFNTDFGDDRTLTEIARQLDELVRATGGAIVFFRAGAAPWHDETSCYERTAARMQNKPVRIFASLDVWDICALISECRGYLGSSLHGRIVAMAFALPRLNIVHTSFTAHSKLAAFAQTWEDAGLPHVVQVQDIAQGMLGTLEDDPDARRRKAEALAERYRQEFDAMCAGHFFCGYT